MITSETRWAFGELIRHSRLLAKGAYQEGDLPAVQRFEFCGVVLTLFRKILTSPARSKKQVREFAKGAIAVCDLLTDVEPIPQEVGRAVGIIVEEAKSYLGEEDIIEVKVVAPRHLTLPLQGN